MHVHNVTDFPQAKLDSEMDARFLLNQHGDLYFFQVFAKNSLIENIFEGEKTFDSRTWFVFGKIVPYLVYFGQGEHFKLTTELSEKVQYSHNQAIKNGLNKAILLMWIKEALPST